MNLGVLSHKDGVIECVYVGWWVCLWWVVMVVAVACDLPRTKTKKDI